MFKQTSAKGLLYIKNFLYSLFRILNCFWRRLWVVLHFKSPFLIGVSNSFRSVHSISSSVKEFSFQVIFRNLILWTEVRLCGNYSCKSGANLKINFLKMSQKLIFTIIYYLFSHFVQSFFISIKLISISRLKFGLDIFNISETKWSEQYFHISKEQACS